MVHVMVAIARYSRAVMYMYTVFFLQSCVISSKVRDVTAVHVMLSSHRVMQCCGLSSCSYARHVHVSPR